MDKPSVTLNASDVSSIFVEYPQDGKKFVFVTKKYITKKKLKFKFGQIRPIKSRNLNFGQNLAKKSVEIFILALF